MEIDANWGKLEYVARMFDEVVDEDAFFRQIISLAQGHSGHLKTMYAAAKELQALRDGGSASPSNVVKLETTTSLELNPADMLTSIASDNPDHAFVICWSDEEGAEPTYHADTGDIAEIVYRVNEFLHSWFSKKFKSEEIEMV